MKARSTRAPATNMKDQDGNEVIITKEVDYVIVDDVLDEPFEVYKSPTKPSWWVSENNGRVKVMSLMEAFKKCYRLNQAFVLAGITRSQWLHFNEVHPKFEDVKERCEQVVHMMAKESLSRAIMTDWKPAAWFLERREPELFGRREGTPLEIPEGGKAISSLVEAFVDKDGNLISKRKTIKITNGQPTESSSS